MVPGGGSGGCDTGEDACGVEGEAGDARVGKFEAVVVEGVEEGGSVGAVCREIRHKR